MILLLSKINTPYCSYCAITLEYENEEKAEGRNSTARVDKSTK